MKRTIYRECSARLGFRMFFTLFYCFSRLFSEFSHFALQQEIKKSQLNAALFQLDCQLAKCCHIVAHAKMQANWTVLLLLLFFASIWQATFGGHTAGAALNRVRAPSMAYKLH